MVRRKGQVVLVLAALTGVAGLAISQGTDEPVNPTDAATRQAALIACTTTFWEDGSQAPIDPEKLTPECWKYVGHYVGSGQAGRDKQTLLRAARDA